MRVFKIKGFLILTYKVGGRLMNRQRTFGVMQPESYAVLVGARASVGISPKRLIKGIMQC